MSRQCTGERLRRSDRLAHSNRIGFTVTADQLSFPELERAAAACRACDLFRTATQTVFGDGNLRARVMFVGEQPGDREDIEGKPFVGPAGQVLDEGFKEAGIDRSTIYITNAVKHFKWKPYGKRRLHQKPDAAEVAACRPWLDAEIALVKPELLVLLGATAAQGVLGADFRVTRQRGQFIDRIGLPLMMATVHPSSILRAEDEESRQFEMRAFVNDLKRVAEWLRAHESVAAGATELPPETG
jgi:uracil-DNA glycosylase